MKVLKTMLRAFILGVGLGILLAPRAGSETRRLLSEKFDQLLDGVNDLTDKLDRAPSDTTTNTAYVPNQHYTESTLLEEEVNRDPLKM